MKNKIVVLFTALALTGISCQAAMVIPNSIASEITSYGYNADESGYLKAAQDGNVYVLNLFTQVNAYVNMHDADGRTPVYLAASKGKVKAVKYLLLCGANINARTENMKSPLMAAIEAKSFETAKLLIDARASLNVADENGYTPLHYAIMHDQIGIAQYMVTLFCDIDAPDNFGNTPLFYAVNKGEQYIQVLLNAGADRNAKNYDGKTPLHKAVMSNNFNMVRFLIENGVNLNIADKEGKTPISYAKPHSEIYNLLIESGAKAPD